MKLSCRFSARPLIAAALALSACTDNTAPGAPASFERPNRVAFVCVDEAQEMGSRASLVPLSSCTPPPASDTTTDRDRFALHALITQSSRGEVAAARLSDNLNLRQVIDSRPDIPGPTFVPVGEVPAAIAVAPDFPQTTYVANAGSRDISVVQTVTFLRVAAGQEFLTQRVRLQPTAADPAGAPFDMRIDPDQSALYVTSPESGFLLRIPIKRCPNGVETCAEQGQLDAEAITRIPLEQSWSKVSPESLTAAPTVDEPYRFVCDIMPPLLAIPDSAIALPEASADVGSPQPAGMAFDAFCTGDGCTRRLLVADKRQPIIHALDLGLLESGALDEAVLPPLVTGVPTERVTVTPRVPTELGSAETTQYIYAIDAGNGSVLALKDGRLANVGVNPELRADRLDLGTSLASGGGAPVALSVEVIMPSFDGSKPDPQWVQSQPDEAPATEDQSVCLDPVHNVRSAARLRGVFLAVGLTDGSVRIVNVHDTELENCRTCDPAAVQDISMGNIGYDPFPVVRNRPRIALALANNAEPVLTPVVNVQFQIDGTAIGVKTDGTTNDTRVPGLACVTCEGQQAMSFPARDALVSPLDAGTPADAGGVLNEGATCPRVCSLADPFVDPISWSAVYEDAIPGTRGGRGRFADAGNADNRTGRLELIGDVDFCNAGVLGNDELPAGDQVQILSPLPSDMLRRASSVDTNLAGEQADECNRLVALRDDEGRAIAFAIAEAYSDRLVIEPQLLTRSTDDDETPMLDWEGVQRCFGGTLLSFQVHARESFVVQGSGGAGFQHRVIRDADSGRCRVDTTQDAKRTSRAREGVRFDNGYISFEALPGEYDPLTLLGFNSASSTPKLLLNATNIGSSTPLLGVMPVEMRYNAIDQRLYIVDITARGLIPLPLNPMPSSLPIVSTIR